LQSLWPGLVHQVHQGPQAHQHQSPEATSHLKKKARRANDKDIELEKLELLKEMSKTVRCGFNTEKQDKIEDESSFGRQVTVEVSHIKDPTLKTRAKKKIMTILFDFQEADQIHDRIESLTFREDDL